MKKIPALILMLTLIISVTPATAIAATGEDVVYVATEADTEPVTTETIKNVTPNISAASSSLTKIKVTWDKIEGASGYSVYRATSKSGKYSKVYTTSDSNETYYINSGRTTGKTYYYKIKAFVKKGSKTYYSKYSNISSAYSKPSKVKNLNVEYDNLGGYLECTWDKVSGASGYKLLIRKPGDIWRTYYLYDDGDKYSFVDVKTKKDAKYITGTKAWSPIEVSCNYFDFKVCAYKTVNGNKVYGNYSDVYRIEGTTTKEDVQKAVYDYVKSKYPNYDYYDKDIDGSELTNENGSYGTDWTYYIINQYNSMDFNMKLLKSVLDGYFDYAFIRNGVDPCGYFYMKEIANGEWQCWWLF